VNDIVLCNSNEAIVSCSSDLTVKLWKPHSGSQQADTIGVHSDYVKCLATPSVHSDWVASGGLDRKIKFWDLNGGGEKLQIDVGEEGNNPKGSIYSLSIGGEGAILASGGPESVVRVWDPRSGKRITKFVGHTDNVRSILVSEQGSMVLTASSDTTIKLWSLTAGRCLHTLSMHNDSVWSLHSLHPGLEIFHSSDRSGLVAKTDVRNVAEIEDGICVAVCQEKGGINKVIAACDYLWTATSSSNINRWVGVDTSPDVIRDIRRPGLASPVSSRPRVPYTASPGLGPGASASLPIRSTIPVSSLLRMSTSSSFPTNVRDPDTVTVYSVASARQASITETLMDGDSGTTIPLNDLPDETVEGQRGLLKHFLLNDRRRVLTVDTAGEVVMWDLLSCIPIKSFGERHLEDVAMEVNTMDSIANWCQVDIRTGKLACVLEENCCFDAEVYADEADIKEKLEFKDDQRSMFHTPIYLDMADS
jgi:WD repeat-containing protein 48